MNSIQPVETKTVNFYGSDLIAVKASDGKIYAAVSFICKGMKMSKGQSDNQVKKIGSDPVLHQGASKMTLGTNGGPQELSFIDLEYLPLWLAKINAGIITDHEIQESVIRYQLKAKDVLNEAFIEKNNVVPLSKDQALVTVLRTTADLVEDNQTIKAEQHEIRKLITQVDEKVETQITLDHGEQRKVQKVVAHRVSDFEKYDKKRRSELFHEIYREIKDRFAVPSYKDVIRKDLPDVVRYIEAFIPKKVA